MFLQCIKWSDLSACFCWIWWKKNKKHSNQTVLLVNVQHWPQWPQRSRDIKWNVQKKKEKTRPTWVHRRIVWPWTSNYIFPVSLSITEVCMCAAYAADVTLGTARTSITHTHTHTHTSAASILGLDLNSPRCCCNSLQSHQLNCSLPKEKKKKKEAIFPSSHVL